MNRVHFRIPISLVPDVLQSKDAVMDFNSQYKYQDSETDDKILCSPMTVVMNKEERWRLKI